MLYESLAMARVRRLAPLMILVMEVAGCAPRYTQVSRPLRPRSHRVVHAKQTPALHQLTESQKEALFRSFSDYEAQHDANSGEAGQ